MTAKPGSTFAQRALAPAKINLFLHVGPLEASGFHSVTSLAVFADVGDRVSLAPAETFEFVVVGPFAPALAGEGRNLVLEAVRGLEAETDLPLGPVRVLLEKTLPVAAGIGGGTADAGATLRLFNRAFDLGLDQGALERIAAGLGSDGPLCLRSAPAIAEGRGERLSPAPDLPELHAVLVNPGRPCATGAVYAAFDGGGSARPVDLPHLPRGSRARANLPPSWRSPATIWSGRRSWSSPAWGKCWPACTPPPRHCWPGCPGRGRPVSPWSRGSWRPRAWRRTWRARPPLGG